MSLPNGKFQLTIRNQEKELGNLEPYLVIRHNCEDGANPLGNVRIKCFLIVTYFKIMNRKRTATFTAIRQSWD